MSENLHLWNTLGKTDPAHTKQFSRAGGFKGTALKPQWAIKQLTEQFGPCGIGWGVLDQPVFQVVQADKETLVYCTVSAWHGGRDNVIWGVGGDKVATVRKDGGVFVDDEAFKKAFTDAVMNAFKFVGVGADIHMGLFDDSKYLSEVRQEFAAKENPPPALITDAQRDELADMMTAYGVNAADFCKVGNIASLKDLRADNFDKAKGWIMSQRRAA